MLELWHVALLSLVLEQVLSTPLNFSNIKSEKEGGVFVIY